MIRPSIHIIFFGLILLVAAAVESSVYQEVLRFVEVESPPDTQWSILIEDAQTGEAVVELHPDLELIPASNMKIVSCGAALLGLGVDFRYETALFRTGIQIEEKVTGHLIVTGNGDPSIGGRFNGGDITALFRQWADELKQRNIGIVSGDLVGVDHAFDAERHGLNWSPEDYVEWYAAEISALTLNDGCIDLWITGASKAGEKARIQPDPPTQYMQITNLVRTVSRSEDERQIELIREPDSTALTVRGAVQVNKRIRDYASVPFPTLFFLTVLKETLAQEGIEIQGEVRAAPREEFDLRMEDRHLIATHRSQPLQELLRVCLKNSQNLYAEHFLKTLGLRGYGKGGLRTGVLVLKDLYFMNGCRLDAPYIADGSGLSRDNRISSRALVEVLRCMKRSEYAQIFQESLPVAGINGTLKNRMKNNAAYQHVYAKTGTLTGVRGLSGYLKAAGGREYIFSMLANGTHKGTRFNSMMDEICAMLVQQG